MVELVSHGDQLRRIGRIEDVEERIRQRPKHESIDAPTRGARAVPVVFGVIDHGRDVDPCAQSELPDRGSPHRGIEPAGDLEDRVMDRLRVEPAAALSPEPGIVRVEGRVRRIILGFLPVNRRGDDHAMKLLERASRVAEVRRQPVEQLRV